jgi:hypothetical protein
MVQRCDWAVATLMLLLSGSVLAEEAVEQRNATGAASETLSDQEVAYRLGRQRFEHFIAVNPFLNDEEASARNEFQIECVSLDRRCVRFLQERPAVASRALPDNPEYWKSYRALLEVSPLSHRVEDLEVFTHQGVINAANGWAKRELLTRGALDARETHFQVMAHRRLLAESGFLIDKMVFTATTGITAFTTNVLMAQIGDQSTDEQTMLLDEMLQPLTLTERSMRKAYQGEREYLRAAAERYGRDFGEQEVQHAARIYEYISDRSELPWKDYWRNGADVFADVPGYTDPETMPAYQDYSNHVRYIDASLHLLRALREIYQGRASPGIPAFDPPASWHWGWQADAQTLCLEPGLVHPSLGEPQPICMEYLDEAP